MSRYSVLDPEEDLLCLLNQIADIVIGNEDPVDVGITELSTLPEMMAYITVHPTKLKALITTEKKLKDLADKIQNLQDKVYVMKKKVHLKNNNI